MLFAFILPFTVYTQNQDIFTAQKPLSKTLNKPNNFGVNYKLSGDKSKIIIISGNQLEIWDTNSRRIILKKQLDDTITNFEINYTGNIYSIIKTSKKNKQSNFIKLFNLSNNDPLFEIYHKPTSPIDAFTKVKFNKNGGKISIIYKSNEIDIYNIVNNNFNLLKHINTNLPINNSIKDFEFSNDDKSFFIFSGNDFSSNKPITYQQWSLESFKPIQTIGSNSFYFNTTIMLQAYAQLGHKIASPGWNLEHGLFVNCKYMQMYSSSKRKGNTDININPNHKVYLELFNAKTEKTINLLSHNVGFNEAIIADSETIITSDENKNIQVWDIKTGKLTQSLNTNKVVSTQDFAIPHLKKSSRIAIMVVDAIKHEIYYSLTNQNEIRVWNYEYNTNEIFQSNIAKIEAPFFTSDSTVVYKRDMYLEHFDFKNQTTIKRTKESNASKPFHFKYSLSTNKGLTKTNNTLKLWNVNSLIPTDSIKIPSSQFNPYFTSPDLSYCAIAISSSLTNTFSSLLENTNKPLDHKKLMNDLMKNMMNKTYKHDGSKVDAQNINVKLYKTDNYILNEAQEISVPAFAIQNMSFIPNSNRILITGFNQPVVNQTETYIPFTNFIYNIDTKKLQTLPKTIQGVSVMIPSTNSFLLFKKIKNELIEAKIVDINSFKVLNSFTISTPGFLGNYKLKFINKDQVILYGKAFNYLLNLSSKTIKKTNYFFDGFDISQSKAFLVTTNTELSFYHKSLENKLYTKYLHKDNLSSITVLPNNYYLNKGKGYELVTLLKNNNAYSFEQFDLKYHRPDLVIEALKETISNKLYKTKELNNLAYTKRLQRIGMQEFELDSNFHAPDLNIINKATLPNKTNNPILNLDIKAFDNKYKLEELQVSVNGVLVKNADYNLDMQQTYSKILPITLSNGKNKILLSVINNKGIASAKKEINVEYVGEPIQPNLYIVSLGISKYEHLSKTPNSSNDAKKIIKLFETKNTNVKSLSLIDNEVTKTNFNKISSFLSSSKENDIIIFFVSGHALRSRNNYFYCSYNSKAENISITGISYDDFDTLLGNTKSRNRLLILNTCYSGEIYYVNNLQEIEAINLMISVFEDLKLTNGTTVISASEGTKKYYESNAETNGAITMAIANLIKTKKEITIQTFCKEIVNFCDKINNADPFKSELNKNTPLIRFNNIYNNYKVW
ncbi:hypothetical protein PW52_01470 [Tamlana sedimentorum]|uniref:Peptidase C14 caspase domain-containing protein n=2 Tax=Neotamlana sedimentorum TaxID=1435349 RepID=A0A0D7WHD0_9FLAO|nr:hypothetical protein PW52_01470 [Tamlana sedimentorum]